MLGHWAFAENFACEKKVCTDFAGVFYCLFYDEDFAVDTGVDVFTVTIFGFSKHANIVFVDWDCF